METETIKTTMTSLKELLPEVYGDTLKPGMTAVGHAIGDALEFCLLPVTAMGYVPKLTKLFFDKHLKSFEKKLNDIPKEKIVGVHQQISVPVIQKLLYTTNDTIAELFINLLASSANIDVCSNVHPGFVYIISQLSPDEAKIIKYLKTKEELLYAEIHAYVKDGEGYEVVLPKSTLIPYYVTLDIPDKIQIYYSNLMRLGILEDKPMLSKVDVDGYNEISTKYKFEQYKKQVPDLFKNVEVVNSFFEVTPMGKLFISACTSKENE